MALATGHVGGRIRSDISNGREEGRVAEATMTVADGTSDESAEDDEEQRECGCTSVRN